MNLRFSGSKLLALSKKNNPHSLSLLCGISYPTVLRYTHPGAGIQQIDLVILGTLLSQGCELNAEQIAQMKIGDLFDVRG